MQLLSLEKNIHIHIHISDSIIYYVRLDSERYYFLSRLNFRQYYFPYSRHRKGVMVVLVLGEVLAFSNIRIWEEIVRWNWRIWKPESWCAHSEEKRAKGKVVLTLGKTLFSRVRRLSNLVLTRQVVCSVRNSLYYFGFENMSH